MNLGVNKAMKIHIDFFGLVFLGVLLYLNDYHLPSTLGWLVILLGILGALGAGNFVFTFK